MAKNLAKRRQVMARSMQLGHCICDPRRPCPCPTLREHDVCPCAGEHLEPPPGAVRLTERVASPGCASKIDAATLRRVLAGLSVPDDPRVLVGMPAGDDAGVYRLDDHVALVQTVDVFAPSVDDPYLFGQIAAANSLSDVYAMGGRPITALSIIGFPARSLPDSVMREILRGGIDKMAEAGVAVIGGHSIQDEEVKAGFAVTGLIDPERVVARATAKPGDRLVLTKPIGTGIIAFAAQIGRAPPGSLEAAGRSMAALNRTAADAMLSAGAHAATDVTGFGLFGHLAAMAADAGVDVEVLWDDIPLLPGVLECLAEGIVPGGAERNRESAEGAVAAAEGVTSSMLDVGYDPQTSGGLLIAVAEENVAALVAELHRGGISGAAVIGRVLGPGRGRVHVRTEGRRMVPAASLSSLPAVQTPTTQVEATMSCCGHDAPEKNPSEPATSAGGIPQAQEKFVEFLGIANAPGRLDARTKRAIAIALSVQARCEPCLKSHIQKARQMGFTQEEIDEAAWLAIAFAGSPAMMFYNALRKS